MIELNINNVPVKLYDRKEIRALLGISREVLQRAISTGALKYRIIGKKHYSTDAEIGEYLGIKK